MKVLITGADGFIGKNLLAHLAELPEVEILRFTRANREEELLPMLAQADIVFHLAGVNRPKDPSEFDEGNAASTRALCAAARTAGLRLPILYASSIQAALDNPYGASKRAAEECLLQYQRETGAAIHIFRLPNVFGKWCRPNYNSAVATFCHNTARDLGITVHDPAAPLKLVYIDDVVRAFLDAMRGGIQESPFVEVAPVYETTVGEVAGLIRSFRNSRASLLVERVGTGLVRALYSTYMSYLDPSAFAYPLTCHADARGVFVEMLRTPDCGQFSYFTAHPGVTRGGHYHHSKTEKFLVVKGKARFGFRHIVTNEYHEILTSGVDPRVVETVPGWTHDITNVGPDEMVVMLWANELFDPARPDTIARKV